MTRRPILVHKNRNVSVGMNLGYDLTGSTFEGVIRAGKTADSDQLAEWTIDFLNDGSDGEIVMTLQPEDTADIVHTVGYTDLKQIIGSEVLPVFEKPVQVTFIESLTP